MNVSWCARRQTFGHVGVRPQHVMPQCLLGSHQHDLPYTRIEEGGVSRKGLIQSAGQLIEMGHWKAKEPTHA